MWKRWRKKEKEKIEIVEDEQLLQEISPAGDLLHYESYSRTGTGYEACVHIWDYPEVLDDYWLTKPCNQENTIVTISIHNEDQNEVKKNLNRSIEEQGSRKKFAKEYKDFYDAAARESEMKALYDEINAMGEVIKSVAIRIFAAESTKQSLENSVAKVIKSLEGDTYRSAVFLNETRKEWKSVYHEGNDKQKIEHGIDNSGKNQEIQRMAGIADSAENAGAHVVEHQTGNTAKVNFKIRCRLTDDIVRCAHHAEHVRRDENAENGKDNGENKRHHQCRADGAADLFIRLCAIILRDNDTGTGGKSHEKADQRIDDRTDGADGGECFLADKVADNDAVNGVVKLLEEISGHQRKREEKKLFPDRALGHIAGFALLYCFRHSSPLFYVDFTFFFIVAL